MSRKIFNYKNFDESKTIPSLKIKSELYSQTISACGCLFYKKNKQELLLISYEDKNWPNYDDFGGTVNEEDLTVFDTMCREVSEETNNVITETYMKNILKEKKYASFYNEFCKYFFIVVSVEENFHSDTNKFGKLEETDNIARTINWIKYDKALPKLATRLKCEDLLNFFNNEFELKPKPKKGFPMGF